MAKVLLLAPMALEGHAPKVRKVHPRLHDLKPRFFRTGTENCFEGQTYRDFKNVLNRKPMGTYIVLIPNYASDPCKKGYG
jgi:hypothetical protein